MSRSRARLFTRAGAVRANGGAPGILPHPADVAERIENAHPLDQATRVLATAVLRATADSSRADALHGVWLGQPAHPGLSDLPIGCWTSAALLDLLPGAERASRTLIAVGLASALPAAATGFTDWAVLHHDQQRVGLVHAAANVGAAALFAASLTARASGRERVGRMLTLGGLAAVAAGAYLGRHMAFPLAAGASHAEPVAHLAPLGWHDLCRLYELPDGRLARRRLGYLDLAVLRQESEVFAVADQCGHLGGPLHQGTLGETAEGPCLTCPWHGSTFAMRDGSVLHGPATARQPAFEARLVEGGMVQVRPLRPRD